MQRMPILSETDMSLFELKTRYVRNYLTFAGKNSKDYLLYISGPGVYDSPAVDVELQTIPGKNPSANDLWVDTIQSMSR